MSVRVSAEFEFWGGPCAALLVETNQEHLPAELLARVDQAQGTAEGAVAQDLVFFLRQFHVAMRRCLGRERVSDETLMTWTREQFLPALARTPFRMRVCPAPLSATGVPVQVEREMCQVSAHRGEEWVQQLAGKLGGLFGGRASDPLARAGEAPWGEPDEHGNIALPWSQISFDPSTPHGPIGLSQGAHWAVSAALSGLGFRRMPATWAELERAHHFAQMLSISRTGPIRDRLAERWPGLTLDLVQAAYPRVYELFEALYLRDFSRVAELHARVDWLKVLGETYEADADEIAPLLRNVLSKDEGSPQ